MLSVLGRFQGSVLLEVIPVHPQTEVDLSLSKHYVGLWLSSRFEFHLILVLLFPSCATRDKVTSSPCNSGSLYTGDNFS